MTRSGQQSSAVLKTPAASTRPTTQTCSRCGDKVLGARTTAGITVQVGAAPLSPVGELRALMAGVTTYTHHVVQGDLAHRYPLVIRSRPAGTRLRQTVHALHRCGDDWPALPLEQLTPAARTHDDAPPY